MRELLLPEQHYADGRNHGCRRAALARASGAAVQVFKSVISARCLAYLGEFFCSSRRITAQVFSVAELVIGARTAATGALTSANCFVHLGEFFCSSRRIILFISACDPRSRPALRSGHRKRPAGIAPVAARDITIRHHRRSRRERAGWAGPAASGTCTLWHTCVCRHQ